MSLDKRAHVFFFHATRVSNARNLEFCSGRRNIRVQTRPRGCHQVDRDRSIWILLLKLLYVTLYTLEQVLVGRSQIRAAARCWIVSSSRVRRSRVKIARAGECLPNDSRPYELSIFLDELSVRAVVKEYLCQSRDSKRVDEAEHDGCYQSEPHGNEEILFHKGLLYKSQIREQHIDHLNPYEGSDDSSDAIEQQIAAKQYRRSHRPITHASHS